MRKNFIKILIIIISVLALASCSTLKSKFGLSGNKSSTNQGVTTRGINEQSQFNNTNTTSATKLKAPHDQVYYFGFDQDAVSQDDIASIDAQASYLAAHRNVKVRLDGNTDERGSREYNIALGWRRAKAVARILEQEGVAPDQIITNSYGEERPVAFCHKEMCYKLNRRVTLTYINE